MNMLASGFANFINGIFANWQMLLFVVGAVLLLMTILFRKFKITFVILIVGAIAVGGVLVVDLVVEAMTWKLIDLITFLVKWVPTVLFALFVILGTLFGTVWGLRKSLIFLLHAAIVGVLCIILYAVLINVKAVDGLLLTIVNFFMGGEGALQDALGVTAECAGLKDVLVEWLPTIIPDSSIATMLGDSREYIYTLADLIYHVAFAVVLFVVYVILNIILYVIYHCFYSERKYKEKITKKYADNKVDRRYRHHTLGGSVVGLVRGTVTGLIALSFLGTGLFVVAGRGDGTMKEYDFGNEQYNEYYSYYRAVEGYGTHGIFKLLNMVSSPDKSPYYLFVADLVLSGELHDGQFGIDEHIVFRKELDAYTGFARNAVSLLMQYGGDKLRDVINGEEEFSLNTVLEIMKDDNFRAEFNDLITEFDTQTYVINLAMSFIDSAIANIDDMSFASGISEDNRELLKILFTKGYYSDTIPDERAKKDGLSSSNEILPYLNVSRAVSKRDVQILFNVVIDLLGSDASTVNDTVSLVGKILPQVEKISWLSNDRAKELNPVLGRLYTYAANRFLTSEGSAGVTYHSVYAENIDWVSEIRSLVKVAESAVDIYGNLPTESEDPMDIVISLFDKENTNYRDNIKNFEKICTSLEQSKLLGNVLSSSYISNLLRTALGQSFEGIYIPEKINYANTYDAKGKLIAYGELYNLFNGVLIIGENSDLLNQIKSFTGDGPDMEKFLTALGDAVSAVRNGKTLATYITESVLLRSVISSALMVSGAEYIYVPTIARDFDENGTAVNCISKKELFILLDYFEELVKFVTPVITGEGNEMELFDEFINSEAFNKIITQSTVFEGTLGKLIVNNLSDNDVVVIPKALQVDLDGWASVYGTTGEVRRLINAFKALGLDIASLTDTAGDDVLDKLLELIEEDLDVVLQSKVVHYTVSKFLIENSFDFGTFALIVPTSAQQLVYDDVLESLVVKSELKSVLRLVRELEINDETDLSDVLVKVVKNKQLIEESNLLSASIVYAMANGEVADMLNLNHVYASSATLEKVKKFNSSNPWKRELPHLIDALDEILEISSSSSFTFDEEALTEKLSTLFKQLKKPSSVDPEETRLRMCYASEIIANNITVRLDEVLVGNVDADLLVQAKSDGLYSYDELATLSDALDIFGIDDIMTVTGDQLTEIMQGELLDLTSSAGAKYDYRSKLEVIYPSVIISGMMSKQLDSALLDTDNGGANPVIDGAILRQIKQNRTQYPEEEFANLINAISYLGVDDYGSLDSLDFDSIKTHSTNMERICRSLVMRAVFTKQIEEAEICKPHPLSYEEDVKIFKSSEIISLVNLIVALDKENDGDLNLEDMSFDELNVTIVRNNTFIVESGEVTSYLLLSAISDMFRNEDVDLTIDSALIDEYDCINAEEVLAVLNAFAQLENGGLSIAGWSGMDGSGEGDGTFNYPDESERAVMLKSHIVRTKISEQLVQMNAGQVGNFIGTDKVRMFVVDGTVSEYGYVIIEEELNALFTAIDAISAYEGTEGGFELPKFTFDHLVEYRYASGNDYLLLIYSSDILCFKMCSLLLGYGLPVENVTATEVYDLNGMVRADQTVDKINSVEDVREVIDALEQLLSQM